jgi:hypothetical protein
MGIFHTFHISLGIFHLSHLGPWDRLWFFRFSDLLDQRRWSWMSSIANTKSFMMRRKRRLTGAGRFYFLWKVKECHVYQPWLGMQSLYHLYIYGDDWGMVYFCFIGLIWQSYTISLSIYLFNYLYIYMHRYIHTYSERERVKQHYNAYCGKPNNKLSLISPGLGCTKPPKLNG